MQKVSDGKGHRVTLKRSIVVDRPFVAHVSPDGKSYGFVL